MHGWLSGGSRQGGGLTRTCSLASTALLLDTPATQAGLALMTVPDIAMDASFHAGPPPAGRFPV